jgi:hypothetical protein
MYEHLRRIDPDVVDVVLEQVLHTDQLLFLSLLALEQGVPESRQSFPAEVAKL